jgi:hypothetical protein
MGAILWRQCRKGVVNDLIVAESGPPKTSPNVQAKTARKMDIIKIMIVAVIIRADVV